MLVQDLLTASMRSLGVIAQEETPSTSELTDALYAANDVLSSWSPDILPVLPLLHEIFPVAGPMATLGQGGTFNTVRPVKIEAMAIVAANGARQAVRMIPVEEYESRPDITVSGLFAEVCYCDGGYPLMTLYFLPTPAAGGFVYIDSYKPLTAFVNLTDTVNLAPGYTRALRWALAFEMAPEYGRPVTQELSALAAGSKATIAQLNQAILGRPNQVEPTAPPVPAQQAPIQT